MLYTHSIHVCTHASHATALNKASLQLNTIMEWIPLFFFCSIARTTEHLGSGQFGTVNKGIWHSTKGSRAVAIKILQPTTTGEVTIRFLQEVAVMGQFRHPNIVQLLGVVTIDKPVGFTFIATAFAVGNYCDFSSFHCSIIDDDDS